MKAKEIVQRFLSSVGRPEAADTYLRWFRGQEGQRFAVVMVGQSAIETGLDALIADLRFLHELELRPVLCFETGEDRDALLARFPEARARDDFARAEDAGEVLWALVSPSAKERRAVVTALCPTKVVYLQGASGLQPQGESVRSLVSLKIDFAELCAPSVLAETQRDLLIEVSGLFAATAHNFTTSITSPFDLLRELFTVRGAGTLIRRGTEVTRHDDLAGLNKDAVRKLLVSAFGREPNESVFAREVEAAYLAGEYRGLAVIEATEMGSYLSKFAVDLRAQGEGIGRDLWNALIERHVRFYWRSRPNNAIAPWYEKQCDGLVRGPTWNVYWRGYDPQEIGQVITSASRAPADFSPSHA